MWKLQYTEALEKIKQTLKRLIYLSVRSQPIQNYEQKAVPHIAKYLSMDSRDYLFDQQYSQTLK